MSKPMKTLVKRCAVLMAAGALFGAGWVSGQQAGKTEPTLLHVFAYTPTQDATPADFDNFKQATAALIGKVPGLKRAWVGKLRVPMDIGTDEKTDIPKRLYGVAMEFDDQKALEAYGEDPAHDVWERAYRKVREPGTATFDILGDQ